MPANQNGNDLFIYLFAKKKKLKIIYGGETGGRVFTMYVERF